MTASTVSEGRFWRKVKGVAARLGAELLYRVFLLWYCMRDVHTPLWVKAQCAGALLYFIMPLDAIPDALPGGFVDDAGLIATTLVTIDAHVTDEHRARARSRCVALLGVAPGEASCDASGA